MAKFNLNHTLEILKAAFPYMDSRSKNSLDLFIKAGEFFESIDRHRYDGTVSAYSMSEDSYETRDKPDIVGMLKSIREVSNDSETQIIDSLLNIINAMDLYETYLNIFSSMSSDDDFAGFGDMFGMGDISNNPEDIIEMLSLILSPEDKESLENINMILSMMNTSNSEDSNNDEDSNPDSHYYENTDYGYNDIKEFYDGEIDDEFENQEYMDDDNDDDFNL